MSDLLSFYQLVEDLFDDFTDMVPPNMADLRGKIQAHKEKLLEAKKTEPRETAIFLVGMIPATYQQRIQRESHELLLEPELQQSISHFLRGKPFGLLENMAFTMLWSATDQSIRHELWQKLRSILLIGERLQ